MAYLLIAVVVLVVGMITFKKIRKGKLPSNSYTPYDDITTGKKDKE